MNKKLFSILLSSLILGQGVCLPVGANESFEELETTGSSIEMYRLYNPNSGEHFYTAEANEKNTLIKRGWKDEGIGWYAPSFSNTPVYRLYNPNGDDHHYTIDQNERNALIRMGWRNENIGWYSDDAKTVPLYRQYNPNAKSGNHNYTTSKAENDHLGSIGWNIEGIGWYALKEGKTIAAPTEVDYAAAYRPILNEAKNMINNKGKGNYSHFTELQGIYEGAASMSLNYYGYIIQDFSGDGIPELIIASKDSSQNVLTLYTLVNNQPVNVFYGWSRSCNYYAGGSTFIYNGSGGAAYSSTGLFSLSKDGRQAVYSEYYYTEPGSSLSDIGTYFSTNPNSQGRYVGGLEVYHQNNERILSKQQSLNLTPLSQWK